MNRSFIRTALSLLIVVLYVAGLMAMFMGNVRLGVDLWVVSTLGGIGLLYYIRTTEKTQEAVKEALKEEEALARQEDSDD